MNTLADYINDNSHYLSECELQRIITDANNQFPHDEKMIEAIIRTEIESSKFNYATSQNRRCRINHEPRY